MPDGPSFGETVAELVQPNVKIRQRASRKAHVERDTSPVKPREARAVKALASGEAKSVSAALRIAGFNPGSSQIRDRMRPDGALGQLLAQEMEEMGLGRKVTLCNLLKHTDAKKMQTVAGEATQCNDNDAQLRAIENIIKLQERAGMIPSAASESGSSSITVNVLVVK